MYGSGDTSAANGIGLATAGRVIPLSEARRGDGGVIVGVGAGAARSVGPSGHGVPDAELEQRLLEIGFVEGARIRVLHEGPFGRDPIAVRLDDTRVALRRREAADVLIALDDGATHSAGR